MKISHNDFFGNLSLTTVTAYIRVKGVLVKMKLSRRIARKKSIF